MIVLCLVVWQAGGAVAKIENIVGKICCDSSFRRFQDGTYTGCAGNGNLLAGHVRIGMIGSCQWHSGDVAARERYFPLLLLLLLLQLLEPMGLELLDLELLHLLFLSCLFHNLEAVRESLYPLLLVGCYEGGDLVVLVLAQHHVIRWLLLLLLLLMYILERGGRNLGRYGHSRSVNVFLFDVVVLLVNDHSYYVVFACVVAHCFLASGHHCGDCRCRAAAAVTDRTPRDELAHGALSLSEVSMLVATLVWSVVETGKPV